MAKKINTTVERKVQGYPPKYYYRLCIGYTNMKDEKMARFITDRIKEFFNTMTESERSMILKYETKK